MKLFFLAAVIGSAGIVLAAEPISLFNGKDLSNWQIKAQKAKGANKWSVGEPRLAATPTQLDVTGPEGAIVNLALKNGDSWDLYSKQSFGSCHIELDFLITKGCNSGVYVMGEYEVQIFDSFGKKQLSKGDMAAIDGVRAPSSNASKRPGEWQNLVIDWQAPTFDAEGKKTANAKFIKVDLNGTTVQTDVEVTRPSPDGITGKEAPEGPLMFQGTHSSVAYRNITVTPLK